MSGMTEQDWLARRFEEHRGHLLAVAYRMLGSAAEADDAVQEAWLRLSRTEDSQIENLGGWLTTVVGRVCLDALRARRSRREEPHGVHLPDEVPDAGDAASPEQQAMLADSVGLALLVVLDTLAPAERTAFVLHDMFGVPFEDIGAIVGRSPAAARQLASRGRRRVRGAPVESDPSLSRQREVVTAFLAASRAGDFDALLDLLDPDAELRADSAAASLGSGAPEVRGAAGVARIFAERRAGVARLALVDGAAALVWAQGGRPRVVFSFTLAEDKISQIMLLADPGQLSELEIEFIGRD
jgi:RNA polymerase sigma factor (sigma-70 family)